MAQIKMKYGIDLGTTNSAICKMENGEPIIKKTDTLKDTLPSSVSLTKKKIVKVGDSAYNDLRQDRSKATKTWTKDTSNVYIEFKRTMGLDTRYTSSNMGRDYSSEELSAEVLKTLKSFVSDDDINAAVITIPAKFDATQVAATKRAATMAGIEYCELLQEPIAASMAYGMSSDKKDGYWMVFDFGGGTFDAALLKVEDGIMKVTDTEGDNYLGGKNLDYAIVDSIIIPYLKQNYTIDGILADEKKREILRDAVKYYAEQAKNQLSFKPQCDIMSQLDEFGVDDEGEDIELDMVVTQEEVAKAVAPIFQKAIDKCKDLLKRNNLTGSKLDSLILVGGPTYSPVLRQMLKEQVTPNVDTSIDPMTAVAKGAALFAATQSIEVESIVNHTDSNSNIMALDVRYEANSVETIEFVTVKLNSKECLGEIPSQLFVELIRGDKSWSSGKVEINEIGDVIECQLNEGRANAFTIVGYDGVGNPVQCFPNEITIIQGTRVGNAVLPYHIGIEARDTDLDRDVFVPLKGLEKNQQLPAVGVRNGLKTAKKLRPGMEQDRLLIPIYQGEYNAEGTSAIHNNHVFNVVITGDDVPMLIPEDSDIDITLKVDCSQQFKLEVFFVSCGETVEKDITIGAKCAVTENQLSQRLDEAKHRLRSLKSSKSIPQSELQDAENLLTDVCNRFDGEKSQDDGKDHLLKDLREAFRKMEEVEKKHEWESIEAELKHEYERLEEANNELGHEYDDEVRAMRSQVDDAIRSKDPKIGREVLSEVRHLFFQVAFIYQLIGFVQNHNKNFGRYHWKDSAAARGLLNQAQEMIDRGENPESIRQVIVRVIDLLDIPDDEKPHFNNSGNGPLNNSGNGPH